MVTEILVKEPLERDMIEGGSELLNRLEKSGIKVAVAFWLWSSETGRWELVISSSWVNKFGASESFRQLHGIYYGNSGPIAGLKLLQVDLAETKRPLIKALRAEAKKYRKDFAGERLKGSWFGDAHFEDAYIYFVK